VNLGILGSSLIFISKLSESFDGARVDHPAGEISIPTSSTAQFIRFHMYCSRYTEAPTTADAPSG
jgi:hypothetical protein